MRKVIDGESQGVIVTYRYPISKGELFTSFIYFDNLLLDRLHSTSKILAVLRYKKSVKP